MKPRAVYRLKTRPIGEADRESSDPSLDSADSPALPVSKHSVVVLGVRGFPGVQGGVETHAENLYPLLRKRGFDVTVITRAPYVTSSAPKLWRGVKMVKLWSPKAKALEAVFHTLLGVLWAGIRRPDIVHIHAIGPALWTPLARLLGLRVVVTHHGAHYEWAKWSALAKWVLRAGESFGMRFANGRIAVSAAVSNLVREKYGVEITRAPNGVTVPPMPSTTDALSTYSIERGKYFLHVGRLVEEKRHFDLIKAFELADVAGWKLVIVGGVDHPDQYSTALKTLVAQRKNIVMTGYQSGVTLQELFANAGGFVLPSSHEGFSIAILEALSYGLPVVASDIPGNREIGLPAESYVPMGDCELLSKKLTWLSKCLTDDSNRESRRQWVRTMYSWDHIADQTAQIYRDVLKR